MIEIKHSISTNWCESSWFVLVAGSFGRLSSLLFVVAREGFLLALFGYIPAYFSGQILYAVIRDSTKLPISMDSSKAVLIFVLILIMCMGSAAIAMRKLVDADPAEIF